MPFGRRMVSTSSVCWRSHAADASGKRATAMADLVGENGEPKPHQLEPTGRLAAAGRESAERRVRAGGVRTSGLALPVDTHQGTGAFSVANRATVCLIRPRSRVSFSTILRVPQ